MSILSTLPAAQPGSEPVLKLKLYITGGALNSLRAITNLRVLCERHFPDRYQIEVVDIYEEPLRALTDQVLMTPTLIKIAPPPIVRVAGDLSKQDVVLLALRAGWPPHE